MTKQEQIEEFANYYCEYCKRQTGEKFCEHIDDKSCNIFFEAELFYNAGYRKLPENIILLDFNTEAGMAFCTVMPRDEFVLNVSARKAVEKNTVKEFAEKLKEKAFNKDMFNDWAGATYVVLVRDIDGLLKQYCVEV